MSTNDNATDFRAVTQPGDPWRRTPRWTDALRWAVHVIATRQTLLGLDDRTLADIGLSRPEAAREARRKPWDIDPPRDPARRWSGRDPAFFVTRATQGPDRR